MKKLITSGLVIPATTIAVNDHGRAAGLHKHHRAHLPRNQTHNPIRVVSRGSVKPIKAYSACTIKNNPENGHDIGIDVSQISTREARRTAAAHNR